VTRIAAHAADLVRRREESVKWDDEMSKARSEFDWEKQIGLALNPVKARRIRENRSPGDPYEEGCSMCGDFCAIKILKEYLKAEN